MADEKAMVVDGAKSGGSSPALWYNYTRQSVPRLISDYTAIRVSRTFNGADRFVVVNTSGVPSSPDDMQWYQLNATATNFRMTLAGTNLQSVLLKQFGLFRIRCLKITLVPLGVPPHQNAVRIQQVAMFPSQPFNRLTGTLYDPGVAAEYPTWRDLKDADEYMTRLGTTSDRVIEINYIPQTATTNQISGATNYEPCQMPWLAPNQQALDLLCVAPWIGWRKPYDVGGVAEVARYTVYQDAIIEFKEAVGNQTD